jgi:superfamily II DNA or RNA helicase
MAQKDLKAKSKYVDLKVNGKLFPSWIVANFPKFKLPEIIMDANRDACNETAKSGLREYQLFVSKILDYNSPYRDLLIYHGLGAGKTAATINLYNVLYNSTPAWNVFILLKATLRPGWIAEMEKWLQTEDKKFRLDNVKFISYDAPNADKSFMDAVKNADTSKKNFYVIEEAHNFIRNVYSNISSKAGKRAQSIYDYIIQDKKENDGVRVVLLTATPTINKPFELALLFNLLRPNIFPKSESQFNTLYVSGTGGFERLNPNKKNNFERRILGLVSYYIGSTPDYFATKKIDYVDVPMSPYQEDLYSYFEGIEESIAKKSKGKSQTYMSYTRQASNFVFPPMTQGMTGENRPRPRNFKVMDRIDRGKDLELEKDDEKYYNVQQYTDTVEKYAKTFDSYLNDAYQRDKKNGYTIVDDIKKIREKYVYDLTEFALKEEKKSTLFNAMYNCSAKMLYIIINILRSPGPVLVYSNYVLMEGIQIFKIYLKYFGFSLWTNEDSGVNDFRYIEYHGGIDVETRGKYVKQYNVIENKHGKLIKIIMISPAGAEGLSLMNTRQVHIMEPYWHEVRIEQMIGRAIRLCSHKELPKAERQVDVYRYKSVRMNGENKKITADQLIENLARGKQGLLQSFEDAVREAAIDCELYKAHNFLKNDYKCFKFDEPSLFNDQIGPAYKDDIYDDLKMDNGLNSVNSQVVRIKVIKISAVKILTKDGDKVTYSNPEFYWYNPDTQVVYDFEMHYPYGKVGLDDDEVPMKLDSTTYIIDKVIPIPHIS